MIRVVKILGVLAFLALGVAVYAAGLRPAYLFGSAPVGSRIAGPPLVPPDQRALRVAVLGTSLTARYVWPEKLRGDLAACLGRPVEVAKTARPGAGSTWGVEAAHEVAARRPDLTLIEFSINDADLSDWIWGGGIWRNGAWLDMARRRHEAIIETLRAARPDMRIALVTMSPAHGPRGWVRPFLGAHEDMYRRLAEEMDLDLIDLAPLWADALREGGDMLPDGLHPTEAAVANVALPAIIRQVGLIVGAAC